MDRTCVQFSPPPADFTEQGCIRRRITKQAMAGQARICVETYFPYCITNFKESRLNLEYDDVLEIKDIRKQAIKLFEGLSSMTGKIPPQIVTNK